MPARFTLTKLPEGCFDLDFIPKYNIAPSDEILVLALGEFRRARFGFVREFSNSLVVNCRSETVANNKVFRNSYINGRCIVFVDSFYEWKIVGDKKIPYRVLFDDESVFGMAGVCEEKEGVLYVCVLTCAPNELIEGLHPRMPVILREKDYEMWLLNGDLSLLRPYSSTFMKYYEVRDRVNNSKLDHDILIEPVNRKTLLDF